MKKTAAHALSISYLVKRALEGKISPLNFMIILGFFSTIVLLYISLRVHYYTITGDISSNRIVRERLENTNAELIAEYTRMSAPERIIPLAEGMGLQVCSQEDVIRLTLYDYRRMNEGESAEWEQATGPVGRTDAVDTDVKGR
jgi:hypothetical protein